jgi:hypothetical protein
VQRLDGLVTGTGEPLPAHTKQALAREHERITLTELRRRRQGLAQKDGLRTFLMCLGYNAQALKAVIWRRSHNAGRYVYFNRQPRPATSKGMTWLAAGLASLIHSIKFDSATPREGVPALPR